MNIRLLLGRALGVFVLLPLLISYGMGEGLFSGAIGLLLRSGPIFADVGQWVAPVALVTLVVTFGMRDTLDAMRGALLGPAGPSEGNAPRQARTANVLGVAARVTITMALLHWAALTSASFAGTSAALESGARGQRVEYPVPADPFWAMTFVPILVALLLGHLWLGSAAAAALRAGGENETRSVLAGWDGAAPLVFLIPLVTLLLTMFWRFE
jgi:hypothetical protein